MSESKALCANRLLDGRVVYLTSRGTWSTDLSEAALAVTPEAEEALTAKGTAAVKGNIVIDPVLITVDTTQARSAVRLREKIRATGPTVRTDLQRAAGQEI